MMENPKVMPDTELEVTVIQSTNGEVDPPQNLKTRGMIMTYLEKDDDGDFEPVTVLGGGITGEEMLKMVINFKTTLMRTMEPHEAKILFTLADAFVEKMEDEGKL